MTEGEAVGPRKGTAFRRDELAQRAVLLELGIVAQIALLLPVVWLAEPFLAEALASGEWWRTIVGLAFGLAIVRGVAWHPMYAWKAARCALGCGRPDLARRIHRCGSGSWMLLGIALGFVALRLSPRMWQELVSTEPSPEKLRGGIVRIFIGGTGLVILGFGVAAARRAGAMRTISRVLPERPADRIVWALFDASNDALRLVRDGRLRENERLIYSITNVHLTSERILAFAPGGEVHELDRASLADLEIRQEGREYAIATRTRDGATRELRVPVAAVEDVFGGFVRAMRRLVLFPELEIARYLASGRLPVGDGDVKLPALSPSRTETVVCAVRGIVRAELGRWVAGRIFVTDSRIVVARETHVATLELPAGEAPVVRLTVDSETHELAVWSRSDVVRFRSDVTSALVVLRGLATRFPDLTVVPAFP